MRVIGLYGDVVMWHEYDSSLWLLLSARSFWRLCDDVLQEAGCVASSTHWEGVA